MTDLDIFSRHRHAYGRTQVALEAMGKGETSAVYQGQSPRGAVSIDVGGDHRIKGISIDKESYREMTESELSEEIVDAYRSAQQIVGSMQMLKALKSISG